MPDTIGLSVADLLGELKRLKARVAALEGGTSSGSISMATSVVSETSFGQSPAVGTSARAAREDHTHGTPAGQGLTYYYVGKGDGGTQDFDIPAAAGTPIVVMEGQVFLPDSGADAINFYIEEVDAETSNMHFHTAPADGRRIAIYY